MRFMQPTMSIMWVYWFYMHDLVQTDVLEISDHFGGCGNDQVEDLKTFLKFKACWQKQMCLLCGMDLLSHTCHWKWRNVPVSMS